jgi:hypothetical protein
MVAVNFIDGGKLEYPKKTTDKKSLKIPKG